MKTSNIATIVKINQPRSASNIYQRKRLFKALDNARNKPIIWVSAPAGSGKTTLITSYLNARKLSCLWYQIDSGDGDIASFFYYLGLAAKKLSPRRKALPLLTPEYLGGIDAFTRNFFRELYSRLNPSVSPLTKGGIKRGVSKGGFAIVLDNYHEAPVESTLHNIIQHGLSEIPDGINVIIISRSEPPSQFVRYLASDNMTLIGWDDLRLTSEESSGISKLRAGSKKFTQQCMQALHERTQGWIAGLVLMLEYRNIKGIRNYEINESTQQPIFDYFASEIFQCINEETQHFLLKTAFLPKITIPIAQKLTDNRHAQQILTGLTHRNYFTVRLTGASETYEYHPLFREFLLSQARKSYPSSKLEYIQSKGAILLEEDGQIEGAITLLRMIGDWQGVSHIILKHAQTLVQEGRSQTLEVWLRSLPQQMLEETSWLLYWLGACRMAFNPTDARGYFEDAFVQFQKHQDSLGMLLAWASIVDSFLYEWDDFTSLDLWIKWLDNFSHSGGTFPSEIKVKMASSMIAALMIRQPFHPDISYWLEQAMTLSKKYDDINLRIQAYTYMANYYFWIGDMQKGKIVVEEIRKLAQSYDASPLIKLTWKWIEIAMNMLITASPSSLLQEALEMFEYANKTGVHVWDHMFYALGIWAALMQGNNVFVADLLQKLGAILGNSHRHSHCHYHYLVGWHNLLIGKYSDAAAHAERSLQLSEETGYIFPQILCHLEIAQVLQKLRSYKEAARHLAHAYKLSLETKSLIFQYMCLLTEAQAAFDNSKERTGVLILRKAMELGRKEGYTNLLWWWDSNAMSHLCAIALEHNIEVEYVRDLIRKRNLLPLEDARVIDNWPWAVRIYTLGRFSVVRDQKSLSISAPLSRKPLELLSALIAFGGRGVGKEMLIEALWPDAEGDVAQQNFETTLHRLRKLLGSDEMLALKDGRLTLDDRFCWVDCWAFERLLTQFEHLLGTADANPDEVDKAAKKIFALYHGHFLGRESDHSWALTLRERLRSRFLRHIKDTGRYWKGHKKTDEAIKYYIKGLEIDPVSEGLCYGLMQCCIELGDFTEAISIYKRFCHTLKTLLNTTPSPKIEDLYHSIKHDKNPKQEDRASR